MTQPVTKTAGSLISEITPDNKDIKPQETPTPPRRGPPLRVDSTLHLAWGLTLNISDDPKQVELGKTFLEIIRNLRNEFQNQQYELNYLDDLTCFISTYLRTLGWERSVFARYQLQVRDKQADIIKNANDLADLTSFSREGIIIRVSSFLGIGSLAELLSRFILPSQGSDKVAPATAQQSSAVLSEVGLILFFGLIGLVGITAFFKWWRSRRIEKTKIETLALQQEYWMKITRPAFKQSLEHLFNDVKALALARYENYREPTLDNDETLRHLIEEIIPNERLYVLPHK